MVAGDYKLQLLVAGKRRRGTNKRKVTPMGHSLSPVPTFLLFLKEVSIMIALRILIGVFLLGLTVWLVTRYAPVVGDMLGNTLINLLSCNSKKES